MKIKDIKLIETARLSDEDRVLGFTIAIDDGFVAYKDKLDLNGKYSIKSLMELSVKKAGKRGKHG